MITIRVGICEDDPLFRDLMADFINEQGDMRVLGAAGTRNELFQLLQSSELDVLLLDINLSGSGHDGLEAALEIGLSGRSLKVIVLSSLDKEEVIMDAITFGRVNNFITKEHYRDVPDAIRQAYGNRSGLHHSSAGKLVGRLIQDQVKQLKSKVTPLQIQILELLSQGYDRKHISDRLFYSEQSVHNEISKITKLLKGRFPYLEWLRLKRHNSNEIIELAKKLNIIS
jgi:DNA-binding NarL/FixJ family response regulator